MSLDHSAELKKNFLNDIVTAKQSVLNTILFLEEVNDF